MSNIIGKNKKHQNGYEYLSLFPFPSGDLKRNISEELVQKSNMAQLAFMFAAKRSNA